jgi:hypothetical protein
MAHGRHTYLAWLDDVGTPIRCSERPNASLGSTNLAATCVNLLMHAYIAAHNWSVVFQPDARFRVYPRREIRRELFVRWGAE